MKYNIHPKFWKYLSVAVIGVSSGWVYYQVKRTRDILENTVDTNVLYMRNIEEVDDDTKGFVDLNQCEDLENYNIFKSTWDSLKFAYARRLVRLANSDEKDYRMKAIRHLGRIKNLDHWHCSLLANMINAKTAVALARSGYADKRLFMEPPLRYHNYNRNMLINATRELLINLYEHSNHPCLGYFLTKVFVYEHDNTHIVDNDSSALELSKFIQSESDILPKCLESLVHHCSIENYGIDLVRLNGLPLMMEIYQRYQDNVDIAIKICQILSDMSVNRELLEAIHKSGWIAILSEWVNHREVKISVPAARALANLDFDNECTYSRHLYVLHPFLRTTKKYQMDVVFVHGLLGGVFYTWRQRKVDFPKKYDKNKTEYNTNLRPNNIWKDLKSHVDKEDDISRDFEMVLDDIPINGNEYGDGPFSKSLIDSTTLKDDLFNIYTQCWPKDWLPQDIKDIRVIGINYGTSLSMWAPICPSVKVKFTLEERSSDLLLKLIEAGVGLRPVVWITHSMGGLIVKNMLLKAFQSEDPLVRNVCLNTKGIIFFSTPHRGSRLANLIPTTGYLLWPSVEVQELRENSPQLNAIHENFLNILKSVPMKVVTFVETKSTLVTKMKFNLLLVEPQSGNPGIGEYFEVPQDHLGICKPVGRYSFLYRKVVYTLKEILKEISSEKST